MRGRWDRGADEAERPLKESLNNSSSRRKPGFPWGTYEQFVIPAKAGIQIFDGVLKKLDSGLRRNDELELFRVSLTPLAWLVRKHRHAESQGMSASGEQRLPTCTRLDVACEGTREAEAEQECSGSSRRRRSA